MVGGRVVGDTLTTAYLSDPGCCLVEGALCHGQHRSVPSTSNVQQIVRVNSVVCSSASQADSMRKEMRRFLPRLKPGATRRAFYEDGARAGYPPLGTPHRAAPAAYRTDGAA